MVIPMSDQTEKTFKVRCVGCGEPFHVRYPLARPDALGRAEVVVECLYCGAPNLITIPAQYLEQEHLVRGLSGRAPVGSP